MKESEIDGSPVDREEDHLIPLQFRGIASAFFIDSLDQ
jgi:hypothetical protein